MRKTTSFYLKPLLAVMLAAGALSVQAAPIPDQATLQFRGSYGIPATMTFTRSGNQYTIVSRIKVPMYSIRFESGGTISGNTLRPKYYKDVRGGKLYAEAKFSGNSITYGKAGSSETAKSSGTTLDLFTLAWQLAANDAHLPSGLNITNGKKLYPVSGMTKVGSENYKIGGGTTTVNKYRVKRGDDTVTYSFAPAFNNIPAEIKYTDDGKTYDLKLTSVTIDGKAVKP